jgi:hypothetical protein
MSKSRDAVTYEELELPVDIKLHTKVPSKWLLLDRETGQVYVGNAAGCWDKLVAIQAPASNEAEDI